MFWLDSKVARRFFCFQSSSLDFQPGLPCLCRLEINQTALAILIYGWLPGWQCKCSIYLFIKSQRAWYKLVIQLSVSLYRISTTSGQRFTITGNNMNIFSYCRHFQYRPYPRTIILRLCHSLPDGKLQKEKRALCFTAGLL